jgi:nucleotide-binding universal stress UspA family protein
MLFHRALFATDFSETSARALEYVFQLHQAGCEEVVLVHVLDEKEISSVMAEPSGFIEPSGKFEREVAQRMARNAEKNLDQLIASLENTGLRVRTHLLEGVPDREIVRIAEAERVDVIVIGSHGKSNAIQRLLGTVSEGVIRNARQPVLVIHRDAPEDTG